MSRDTIGVEFIGARWIGRTNAHALHTINHLAPLAKHICRVNRRPARGADRADGRRTGLRALDDTLVTEPHHPFMKTWWPPGHALGWEHTFVHQWLDFLGAVLGQRPVSADQAGFLHGYRANLIHDAILASARRGDHVEIN